MCIFLCKNGSKGCPKENSYTLVFLKYRTILYYIEIWWVVWRFTFLWVDSNVNSVWTYKAFFSFFFSKFHSMRIVSKNICTELFASGVLMGHSDHQVKKTSVLLLNCLPINLSCLILSSLHHCLENHHIGISPLM